LRPMPAEMAQRLYLAKYPDGFVPHYWDYLIRNARRQGLGQGMEDA